MVLQSSLDGGDLAVTFSLRAKAIFMWYSFIFETTILSFFDEYYINMKNKSPCLTFVNLLSRFIDGFTFECYNEI